MPHFSDLIGISAINALLAYICKLKIDEILRMPDAQFIQHFGMKVTELELQTIVLELQYLRNPALDIEGAHWQITSSWLEPNPGKMFNPERMSDFTGSKYLTLWEKYMTLKVKTITIRQLTNAWLEDLHNGFCCMSFEGLLEQYRCRVHPFVDYFAKLQAYGEKNNIAVDADDMNELQIRRLLNAFDE